MTSSWCFGLAQASRDVRLFLGNVDLAGHRGGVWGLVDLVPGSSLGIGPGLGDHSDYFLQFFSAIFIKLVRLVLDGVG